MPAVEAREHMEAAELTMLPHLVDRQARERVLRGWQARLTGEPALAPPTITWDRLGAFIGAPQTRDA